MYEKKENKKNRIGSKLIFLVFFILALIVGSVVLFNQFYIDILWFKEVGYSDVFFKEIVTKTKLGGIIMLVSFIVLTIYFKSLFMSMGKRSASIEKGKKQNIICLVLGFSVALIFSILVTTNIWYEALEYSNASSFGVNDPIFNLDVSFYVFKLPFYEKALTLCFTLLFLILITTIIASPILQIVKREEIEMSGVKEGLFKRLWHTFRLQIGVFACLFFILLAVKNYLLAYSILYDSSGVVYGATFTDVNIMLPAYRIVSALCIIMALGSLFFGIRGNLKPLFLGAVALCLVSIGSVFIAQIVDSYYVNPNQFSEENQYIENNIEYTRKAYSIDDVVVKEFSANQTLTVKDIKENEGTINNIPVNDFSPTVEVYNSIQGFRLYYEFSDIDVDRYEIDEGYRETFIAAREMNNSKLSAEAQTWINMHTKYTHGYGSVMSTVNKVSSTGQPVLLQQDIPTKTNEENLQVIEPRIYFGELTDTYAITNCKSPEFDYPNGSDNAENYYEGSAGIPLAGFNKIVFSINKGTSKILLSSEITDESKILIRRNIKERVNEIAPFLMYEDDPYIVLSEGRFYWIIDAFTTSDKYPYSKPYDNYNYIRNSIKVVVDAYNGDVTFYQVDKNDPIANTYAKIYPGFLKSIDDMPEGIRKHIRYSEKLFTVQANMYRTYHMTNTQVFYNNEDQWDIAEQFYDSNHERVKINPIYSIMKLPERNEEFLVMIPFTSQNKDNMIGWMAGFCDGEDYGELIVYEFPKQKLVYGPMQIEQRIEQDTLISPQLTLLSQQGSEVLRGNLLTIPIEDSILYVEPIYIRSASGDTSLPEVKMIIAAYGDRVVMDNSLGGALEQIFGKGSDVVVGSEEITDNVIITDTPEANPITEGNESSGNSNVSDLINKAVELFDAANAAQKQGDWATYGEKMQELEIVLNQIKAIESK